MRSFLHRWMTHSSLLGLVGDVQRTAKHYIYEDNGFRRGIVALKPAGRSKGNILISRNHRCFFLKRGEGIPTRHQSHWEVHQIARIFLNLGYSVDAIHYLNNTFVPQKDYSLFMDVKWNLERLSPLLNEDSVKVLQPVTTHPLFQAAAELRRLQELQKRRGVALHPRRQDPCNWAIENADCALFTGNEFTMSTYRYANKPLYRIPCATPFLYPSPEGKDYERCRNRFLFMGGVGMVHKGLDRVLEAFASMPHLSLTICGPVEKEQDFVRAYRKELYETENIRLVGWVDVSSQTFQELANSCVALLHPSCSEGGATSVVNCMHAGLIPIASGESSVDISSEFGIVLKDSSIEEISHAAQSIARLPARRLEEMGQAAWREARENHSCEKFVEEFTKLVSCILAEGKESLRPCESTTIDSFCRSAPAALLNEKE
jgi:glycosyltransferase involved in cell wall biosynthesis